MKSNGPHQFSPAQTYVLIAFLCIGILIIPFLMMHAFQAGNTLHAVLDGVALAIFAGLLITIRLFRALRTAAWGISLSSICIFVLLFAFSNFDAGNALWGYTLPFMCMFLLGSRSGAILTGILFILLCAAMALPLSGTVLYSGAFKTRYLMSFSIISAISYLYAHFREKTVTQLTGERDRTQKFFNVAGITMVLFDTAGRILQINKRGCAILQYPEKELVGSNWFDLLCLPDHRKRLRERYKQFMNSDRSVSEYVHMQTVVDRRGRRHALSCNFVKLWNDTGTVTGAIGSCTDLTDRRMVEEQLEQSRKSLQQAVDIVDNVQVGLYLYHLENRDDDRTLRMVFANRAAEEMTGVSCRDCIGRTLDENFPGLREKNIPQRYAEVVRTGSPIELEDIHYGDDRVILGCFAVKAFPLPDDCVGVSFDNITERKKAEMALARAKETAESASRAKSDFLGVVSHEIRTPMTCILSLTELLEQSSLDDQQKEYIKLLKGAGVRQNELLSNIMDAVKIEHGTIELRNEAFNLREMLEDIGKTGAVLAKHNNLDFSCMVDDTVPSSAVGDAMRLRQVISNLLQNAFKFTLKGCVELQSDCLECTDRCVRLRIVIRDTGIGMSAELMTRIFQPFQQGDASTTRSHTGAGLGLAIAHHIVSLMDGKLVAESAEAKGSTFTCTVSLGIPDEGNT